MCFTTGRAAQARNLEKDGSSQVLKGKPGRFRRESSCRFAEHTQLHPSEKVSEVELDRQHSGEVSCVFIIIFPKYLGMVRVGGK